MKISSFILYWPMGSNMLINDLLLFNNSFLEDPVSDGEGTVPAAATSSSSAAVFELKVGIGVKSVSPSRVDPVLLPLLPPLLLLFKSNIVLPGDKTLTGVSEMG